MNIIINIRAFDSNNLIIRARLCKFTYINNISKIINKCEYNDYIRIKNCYLFHNKNTIDLCFRGTTNINDICFNLNIYPQSFIREDIKIHSGFLKKYLLIRDIIINKTDEIIRNNSIKKIYISGHSSGGAIANIATLDLNILYPEIEINTITFGSPRVANKAFIDEYNKRIKNSIRIVNNNDIIQFLPLPIIYHHIHKPLILFNKNKLKSHKINDIINYFKDNHGTSTYIKNLKGISKLDI